MQKEHVKDLPTMQYFGIPRPGLLSYQWHVSRDFRMQLHIVLVDVLHG